jgi:hypothetical protein
MAYADDLNLLGDNIDTIKNTESLIDASKEVGDMLLSLHQNVDRNRDI